MNVFLGRWQLAKDSFESALQLEPTNLTLRNNVAVCTFYQGHLKEVSVYYNGVVVEYPTVSTYTHTPCVKLFIYVCTIQASLSLTHTHSVSVRWRVW